MPAPGGPGGPGEAAAAGVASGGCAGLVALVTGGASGIGRACVEALLAAGARVGVVDLDPAGAPRDPRVHPVRADVADRAALAAAVEAVVGAFGGLDVLVNNAGISAVGTVEENDDGQWARVLDVNVTGVARASAAALPHLRRSARAAIVNVSSVAAGVGLARRALYSASKGAVHALTLAMAADLVADGVRVNCVAPGTVDTPWVARLLAAADDPVAERRRLAARQPTGRLVTAEEVAAAVVYLASPAAGAVTGTSLAVDGGMAGLRPPGR